MSSWSGLLRPGEGRVRPGSPRTTTAACRATTTTRRTSTSHRPGRPTDASCSSSPTAGTSGAPAGSGGRRREPGGRNREIRYEETTWRARPDWSRDGKRVVYSSYLGRQWNQLWLMTENGENPLQLTYGEFDATAPRWSPAGDRIAYVSNERGNTSLWVLDVQGGATDRGAGRPPDVTSIRWERCGSPSGTRQARPLPARVSVVGPDGRSHAPADAWHHADDGFDRAERRFEYGYFHTRGSSTLRVPAGRYTVEVSRGPEYRAVTRAVEVVEGGVAPVRVALDAAGQPAGPRMVQRRPARAHELRRQLSQRPHPAGVPGARGRPGRGREPDREQGGQGPGRGVVSWKPRSRLHGRHAHHAR